MKKILLAIFLFTLALSGYSQSVDGALKTLTASGTNTYTITEPTPSTYSNKERFLVRFTNANTGAATLNRSGLGAKDIKKADGSNLVAGDIQAGGTYLLSYNGTYYQVVGDGGSGGGGVTDHGALTGLADDDHTQYHNNTRGDARYPQLSGTYNNPTWLNQLAWSKITGAPYITSVDTSFFLKRSGTNILSGTNYVFGSGTNSFGFLDLQTFESNAVDNYLRGTNTAVIEGGTNSILTLQTNNINFTTNSTNSQIELSNTGFSITTASTERLSINNNGGVFFSGSAGTSGQVLTSNGSTSPPTWETPSSGLADPMTTRGDIIYRDATNTTERLAIGTSGQVLTSDGTDISWQTPSTGVTDHGALTGLADDDHTQYHNDARGDARYPQLSGTYNNPTWLNQLAWSKITGAPSFLTANQSITLSGDVSGTGNTAITVTLQAGAVEYDRIQNVTDNRLLGRSAGSAGSMQEITIGSGLSLSAGTLSATGGGTGDVVGPASSVDNTIARYDLTTGKLLQGSDYVLTDNAGVFQLGLSTTSGTTRSINASGSSTDVELTIGSKGAGDITISPGNSASTFRVDGDGSILVAGNATHTVQTNSTATNTVIYPVNVTAVTSNTPATGIGTGIQFITETSSSNNEVGAAIESVTTDATATSEDFDVVIKTMTAGAAATEKARVKSTGQVQLNNYTSSGAFTGTAVANLQVDASGNIITTSVGGGSGLTYSQVKALKYK